MKINGEFGRKIRDYREENDLTREELAELCDLTDKCITKIELGRSDPKLSTVLKLCHTLNLNIGFLEQFYAEKNEVHSKK